MNSASWDFWQEIINYSTPLAGLLIIGFAIWKSTKWVAVQFVQPFLGAEGVFATYLKAQQEQSALQTKELRDLNTVLSDASGKTHDRLDMLVSFQKGDGVHHAACEERGRDLLRIHALVADAVRGLVPDLPQEVDRILVQIKSIVDRHFHKD